MPLSISSSKPKFYTKSTGRKTVLKATIRPTYKTKSPPPAQPETETELPAESTSLKPPSKKLADHSPTLQRLYQETQPSTLITKPSSPLTPESDSGYTAQIEDLQQLIDQATQKIEHLQKQHLEIQSAQTSTIDEPTAFNGISDDKEAESLLHQRLSYLQRENQKLNHQLDLIKHDFEKEKKDLQKVIKDLKGELHRTQPIQENKFFSFSKELREAVKAIESISDISIPLQGSRVIIADSPTPPSPSPSPATVVTNSPTPSPVSTTTTNPQINTVPQPPPQPVTVSADQPLPKTKEKKLLITGVALLTILVLGGVLSYKLTAKPSVDPKLVDEYLSKGQVQGAQTGELSRASKHNNGITPDKNADLPFDQTQWEILEDYNLGIRIKYPANLTERLHTATGATFMRKNSYLFKFQYFTSDQSVEDYFSTRKDADDYTTEPVEMRGKKGLRLTPKQQLDYPVEKYLFKSIDKIFEFTFALPSPQFSEDDFQRIEYMKNNIDFLL